MGPNEKELLGPESWKRGKHVSWKWCLRTEEHYGACQVRGREEQVRGARVAEDDDCNDTASEGVWGEEAGPTVESGEGESSLALHTVLNQSVPSPGNAASELEMCACPDWRISRVGRLLTARCWKRRRRAI
jgi:hypothetical protein